MKKMYLKPEVEIIEVELESHLLTPSIGTSPVDPDESDEDMGRYDYNQGGNSRPRPGNAWDQGW